MTTVPVALLPKLSNAVSGWTTSENQHGKLSDYKGKIVILDFYATWCQPCRAETPRLVAMQQRYGAQGLQVIGLNVGGEDDHLGRRRFEQSEGGGDHP